MQYHPIFTTRHAHLYPQNIAASPRGSSRNHLHVCSSASASAASVSVSLCCLHPLLQETICETFRETFHETFRELFRETFRGEVRLRLPNCAALGKVTSPNSAPPSLSAGRKRLRTVSV